MDDLFLVFAAGGNKVFRNGEEFALVDKGGYVREGNWYLCQEVNKVIDKRGEEVSFVKPLKPIEDSVAESYVRLELVNDFSPYVEDLDSFTDERSKVLKRLIDIKAVDGVTSEDMLTYIKKVKWFIMKRYILER